MPERDRLAAPAPFAYLAFLGYVAFALVFRSNRREPQPSLAGKSSPVAVTSPPSEPPPAEGDQRLAGAAGDKGESMGARFGRWLAFYAAVLFLAGWAYLDHYFRVFGVRWLEFGVNDTIARGFTVLFGEGIWLSLIYGAILALSLVLEFQSKARSRLLHSGIAIALIVMFVLTYIAARHAGVNAANRDRVDATTTLPAITFVRGGCDYRGKLLYLKGEMLLIYKLAHVGGQPTSEARCPFNTPSEPSEVPQVWLAQSGDLQDVRLIHYGEIATP